MTGAVGIGMREAILSLDLYSVYCRAYALAASSTSATPGGVGALLQ